VSVEVRMMTAAGCHLCDEAYAVLEEVRAEAGFELVRVDITGDPQLEAEFREQNRVDADELRRRVAAATSAA
jgi:glutaredoxin